MICRSRIYALLIAQFRVKFDQQFSSYSYFAHLFHEPLDEQNNSRIAKYESEENIGNIVQGKEAITSLFLTKKQSAIYSVFIKGNKINIRISF